MHIGADKHNDFITKAAEALIEYVSSAKPTDFSRKVYYLDVPAEIDISVKDGAATVIATEISEEKAEELANEWYS